MRDKNPRAKKDRRTNSATLKNTAPTFNAQVRQQRSVGLARAISRMGYCSRSRAEDAIHAGRVRINGSVRRNVEAPVHLGKDRVEIDGHEIKKAENIYLMLNKPRGVVTTASDERGRETIYSFLQKYADGSLYWVTPVGRLDKASEGLLLITNDSEWGARIAAPETHLEKTYHVQIATVADEGFLSALVRGVRDEGGEVLRAKRARLLRSGRKNCWLEIVLDQGKNRQIRRMMDVVGVQTLRLIRI